MVCYRNSFTFYLYIIVIIIIIIEQVGEATILKTSIRLFLSRDAGYHELGISWFTSAPPSELLDVVFLIHHSLIILPFDTVYSG
jgi:hypothetical protein